jgi:type 1 glutamine amidotransferase
MKFLKYTLLLLAIFSQFNLLAQKKGKKPITVLIVDGYSNHDWKQTTKIVKQILDESHLFTISVYTAPPKPEDTAAWLANDPGFKNYDVIIQNTNNIQNTHLKWPKKIQHELEDYVKNGGGLYVLHSANNAYPDWEEYNKIIGLGWRPKTYGYALTVDSLGKINRIPPGEGKSTYHNDRSDLLIHVLTNHPINKGYPKTWLTPDVELYRYARGPAENVTVLSYAQDPLTQINWPVEWTVKYGKGRAYVSSMGHLWKGDTYPLAYRCVGFQTTMIRTVEWLGSGKVTYPVPANFPTATTKSVREAN